MKNLLIAILLALAVVLFSGCDRGRYASMPDGVHFFVIVERLVGPGENPTTYFLVGDVERETHLSNDFLVLRKPIYFADHISWFSGSGKDRSEQALGQLVQTDSLVIRLIEGSDYDVSIKEVVETK